MIYGTPKGTITNNKGQFEISDVPNGGLLSVSMIGYSTIHVQINSEKKLYLTLYSNPSRLNELVVTAFANKKLGRNSNSSRFNPLVVAGHPTEKPNSKPSQLNEKVVTGYPIEKPKSVIGRASKSSIAFVEQMPSFPGGRDDLLKFLHDNIRYPQEAKKEGLQGIVIVSFMVEKDGSLSQIHTINDTVGGSLEQEAVRLIKAMPKWIPGQQNGEAVAVPYTLPIRFVLQ